MPKALESKPGRIKTDVEQENLTLNNIGLDKETVLILEHKITLPKNPTSQKIQEIVHYYCQLIFSEKPANHGKLLNYCMSNLVDLSYFVTTKLGEKFSSDYHYLYELCGLLYANAPRSLGNVFMVCDGKQFIFQFPNDYHIRFIHTLLQLKKDDDWNVHVFGGTFDPSWVVTAREYVVNLGEVTQAFTPQNIAKAQSLAAFGMSTSIGGFLEDISPTDIRQKNPRSKIAQIYKKDAHQTRETLLNIASQIVNPGVIVEFLEPYLEEDEIRLYRGNKVLDFIWLLKKSAGENYPDYKTLLMTKLASQMGHGSQAVEIIIKTLESTPDEW